MKISACVIAKTPSEQLSRAIASVRPLVDEVVVVFNGTEKLDGISQITNATVAAFTGANAAKKCKDVCSCVKGDLVDFAALRNHALDLATGDWIFWLDSDDELEFTDPDALRKLAAAEGKHRYGFLYKYGGHDIWNVRFVPQKSFPSKWDYPVHEILITHEFGAEFDRSDTVTIIHKRDAEGEKASVARNLRIATHHRDTKRWAGDARFQYYLGQSLRNVGKFPEAIAAYQKCHSLSGVPDERYLTAEWVSKLYIQIEKYYEATEWAFKCLYQWPERANGFLLAGSCYYHLAGHTKIDSYWYIAVRYFRMGFALPVSGSIIPMDAPDNIAWEASKLYSLCLNRTGDVNAALQVAEKTLAFRDDAQTQLNVAIYRSYLLKEKFTETAKEISSLYGSGSPFADNYVRNAFLEIQGLAPAALQVERSAPALRSPVKTIAFVCSYQWNPWNPTNVTTAAGGSEIAVVELSKRFAERGYDVTVFTDPLLGEPATYDGVRWAGKAYPDDSDGEFDLLIGWRGLDRVESGRAKRRVLWLHDMHVQWSTPKRVALVDAVVANTMWHADQVRSSLPGKRIETLGAGLDPSRFTKDKWTEEREWNWCIWASSWDRGLDFMLEIWPRVRKAVIDAELHVLYGCDGSLSMARKNKDKTAEERFLGWKKIAEETPGVVLHGRVPAPEYDALLLKSGVWAYPAVESGNTFGETFCVGAAEALCAGLRVVVSPRAALAEVASPSAFQNVCGVRETPEYKTRFVKAIADAMQVAEDGSREILAEEARARFDWDRVADRWEERVIK
jgi:glycosyltransferase involved in cell wall biosynthesis